MQDGIPRLRVAALLVALAVLAWLPGAAAEWMFDPRPGAGPRLIYVTLPPDASHAEERRPVPDPESAPQRIDLRGNEIVRPVARYGVDHRGALYELHSPETEVPQLGPPEL